MLLIVCDHWNSCPLLMGPEDLGQSLQMKNFVYNSHGKRVMKVLARRRLITVYSSTIYQSDYVANVQHVYVRWRDLLKCFVHSRQHA